MAADPELHESVAARLAGHDQQYTPNRRAVVDALAAAGAPITLLDILDVDTSLAQSSAYRSLSVMADAGVVRRIARIGGRAHFELAVHPAAYHHHLICEQCGTVRDVPLPDDVEEVMGHTFRTIADATGFTPVHHAVDVYGTCGACRDG